MPQFYFLSLIVDCLWVLSLFQRNFSVGSFFKKQPVFQSLLVHHIWSLLLLQRIFPKVPILQLLPSIRDHLYGCFSYCKGEQIQHFAYNLTFKLSFIAVFFGMVHDKKLFSRSSINHRTFSEGPARSDLFSYVDREMKSRRKLSENFGINKKYCETSDPYKF